MTTSSLSRVLFVDDNQQRFDKAKSIGLLPPDCAQAMSATKAIDTIVDNGPWDAIFLDHDLETFVLDPYPREVTGMDVVRVLLGLDWKPSIVIVHSTNIPASERMEAALEDAGIKAIRISFPLLLSRPWILKESR